MRLTEEYRRTLALTHKTNPHWGASGDMHNAFVLSLGFDDVLDYGCGKGRLKVPGIKRYDPAIADFSAEPMPADLVVSFGVLEHIEPECLDDVLAHMAGLTKKLCYMTIATSRPDRLVLEDGRNAHLIQEDERWWLDRIAKHFKIDRHGFTKPPAKQKLEVYATPL